MSPEPDLVGDYVLGLLEGGELERFEAALRADAALAARVTTLAGRMASLDDTAQPEPVPQGLWARIESRLETPVRPATTVVPLPRRPRRPAWRPLAMAASVVVAAGLGYFAGVTTGPRPNPPMVIAVLVTSEQAPGAIVEAFADNSVRIVPLEAFAVAPGQVLEVWTLPDAATGPVSLGRYATAEDIRFGSRDLPPPAEGQLYEITLEPAPGSPTGRPTGPILAKGLARIPLL